MVASRLASALALYTDIYWLFSSGVHSPSFIVRYLGNIYCCVHWLKMSKANVNVDAQLFTHPPSSSVFPTAREDITPEPITAEECVKSTSV